MKPAQVLQLCTIRNLYFSQHWWPVWCAIAYWNDENTSGAACMSVSTMNMRVSRLKLESLMRLDDIHQ